jgi:hypothetical protein
MAEQANINFTREAFMNPINLGFLLLTTLSAFLLNDFGLISNVLLTTAFGLELMYLGIVPKLPRFRKKVRLLKQKQKNPAENERTLFQSLNQADQKRFLVLKHLSNLIQENFDKLPYSSQGLLDSIRNKIKELLSNYLTLLDLHKRYELYMDSAVENGLKTELSSQIEEIKNLESEKLRKTKSRRVAILQKRLKKFEIAKEKYLVCETHLETIEDAIQYIYEQSMTMSNAEEIGFQLDNLLNEVEETSQLIEDLDQDILPAFTNDWEEELDFDSILDDLSGESEQSQKQENRVKNKS